MDEKMKSICVAWKLRKGASWDCSVRRLGVGRVEHSPATASQNECLLHAGKDAAEALAYVPCGEEGDTKATRHVLAFTFAGCAFRWTQAATQAPMAMPAVQPRPQRPSATVAWREFFSFFFFPLFPLFLSVPGVLSSCFLLVLFRSRAASHSKARCQRASFFLAFFF